MKRLLLICGLALLVVPVVSANNSQPLAFYTSHISIQPTVSQQPGVSNPTKTTATNGCGWDATDYSQRDAVLNSALNAGATATDSLCLISDWSQRQITSEIAADSPNMVLTVTFSTGGSSAVVPTYDKRLGLWVYRICVPAPTYQPGDPALQTVDGSGGGVGVPTTVTLRASNPSGKQIAKIRYDWGFFPGSCV